MTLRKKIYTDVALYENHSYDSHRALSYKTKNEPGLMNRQDM